MAKRWSVTARGLASVEVRGSNWIVALGRGLGELGRVDELERLACEVLPNGTVIARDIASGTGYVVQQVGLEAGLATPEPVPSEEEELFGEPEPTAEEELVIPIFEVPPREEALSVLEQIERAETIPVACRLALAASLEQVEADSGAVILDDRGYLWFSAVDGPHRTQLEGMRLPAGTGVAGYAMEKRRTVVLKDAHADPRHCDEVDALTGYTTRQIVVVPVCCGDQVFGVIEAMNPPSQQRFVEADVEAIQELADALGRRLDR